MSVSSSLKQWLGKDPKDKGLTRPLNESAEELRSLDSLGLIERGDDTDLSPSALADKERHQQRLRDARILGISGVLIAVIITVCYLLVPSDAYSESTDSTWKLWVTIAAIMVDVVLMVMNYPPDIIMILTTAFLRSCQVMEGADAWAGFSNSSVLAVGALLAVSRGIEETGSLEIAMKSVLGNPKSTEGAMVRLLFPVAFVSAFLNNTPVVAVMIPIIKSWSERIGVHSCKFLLPLSYAAIMGGSCTLIGSSVNLIALGAARKDHAKAMEGIGMFSFAFVGVPQVIVGVIYMIIVHRWVLLPKTTEKTGDQRATDHLLRCYEIVFRVMPKSPFIGTMLKDTGFQRIPGVEVLAIKRQGREIAFDGETKFEEGDNISFNGLASAIVRIRKMHGLVPEVDLSGGLSQWGRRRHRLHVEVVLGKHSPLVTGDAPVSFRRTVAAVGDSDIPTWPNSYDDARVIAAQRNSPPEAYLERGDEGRGPCLLLPGDCVLLEAFQSFVQEYSTRMDHFVIMAAVPDSKPPRMTTRKDITRMVASVLVVLVMIAVVVPQPPPITLLESALYAAITLVAMKCMKIREAWEAVDGRLLATIAAAFGLSAAMKASGAAALLAKGLVTISKPGGPIALLFSIYLISVLLSAVINNNAVVLLILPIASQAREALGDPNLSIVPFVMVIIYSASASFLTPIGFQTNLMVWRPGNYTFMDFTKLGWGLQILFMFIGTLGPYFIWA
eukprot:CAMPEP_0114551926 /NCGR_PEP_ID=MMETSP0114-20121206/6857_1 /TAXON_ID=31324 /ORGANISM="Goniomonas sp, Strain m" /LENGTH=726 /DNA_ID=CAMNT_0001736779 /DNA_START=6 /DNA_END=2186 /DNA_ORIENTATION=-